MDRYTLSGFADEAGVSIEEQMAVLEANGIRQIEMRTVDGKAVLDLTDDDVRVLKQKMDARGFSVSAIGSPIGKTLITDDFAFEKERMQKAISMAKTFGCQYIRAFSFYIPEGETPETYADEVIARLTVLAKMAADNGLVYALENEMGIFGDTADRCLYILKRLASPHFRMVFDPANFINRHVEPYPTAYALLKDYIVYFHIKDGVYENGSYVNKPAGEGDAHMTRLLKAAFDDGFSGLLSIEPHLWYLKELNSEQRFTKAADALKKTLAEVFA